MPFDAEIDLHTHEGGRTRHCWTDKNDIAVKRSLFFRPAEPMVVGTYPQRE
jgi:hypothetical protein